MGQDNSRSGQPTPGVYLGGVQEGSQTGEGVDSGRQKAARVRLTDSCQSLADSSQQQAPALVSMETVEKVEEAATVLRDRQTDRQVRGLLEHQQADDWLFRRSVTTSKSLSVMSQKAALMSALENH